MKKILTSLILIITLLITSELVAYAGGPLVVMGGMGVSYGTRPLLYRYDKGSLGMFSNAETISFIEDLFSDWEAVKTSQVTFQQDSPGSLDVDVTASNFGPILNSEDLLGYTPIIFDNDGSLLDAFLGDGAGSSVLGLAGPITVNSGPLVNQIAESQAIFNGKFVNGTDTPSDPETTIDSFMGTIIHEFGHGFGLDHAQINVDAINPGASQTLRDNVPLMFPIAVNDLFLIRRDDISAASFLYPNESQLGSFGTITGKIFRPNGTTPVSGANVIAKNIADPELEAISCVSDFLNDGSGSYTLFAVPPGDYKIEIEPIDLSFTGGSGVGPFTTSKTDKSFQNPVPEGFYTGPNMTITTDESQALVVNVVAGQTISDANIIASTQFIPGSSSGGSSTTVDEIEPNDSEFQAQSISLPVTISGHCSSSDTGGIEVTSDTDSMVIISDLYRFTITESTSINALLLIESDFPENDLDLLLFNEDATDIINASSQTGNVDELISLSIPAGTYLLGVGAFSGEASYKLSVSALSGGSPVLNLLSSESLLLMSTGMNKLSIKAQGSNFTGKSSCEAFIETEGGTIVKVKPKSFSLSPSITEKKLKLKVPRSEAIKLISTDSSDTVTLNVTCGNGANDEIDILLSPTIEDVVNGRKYTRITGRQ